VLGLPEAGLGFFMLYPFLLSSFCWKPSSNTLSNRNLDSIVLENGLVLAVGSLLIIIYPSSTIK